MMIGTTLEISDLTASRYFDSLVKVALSPYETDSFVNLLVHRVAGKRDLVLPADGATAFAFRPFMNTVLECT